MKYSVLIGILLLASSLAFAQTQECEFKIDKMGLEGSVSVEMNENGKSSWKLKDPSGNTVMSASSKNSVKVEDYTEEDAKTRLEGIIDDPVVAKSVATVSVIVLKDENEDNFPILLVTPKTIEKKDIGQWIVIFGAMGTPVVSRCL